MNCPRLVEVERSCVQTTATKTLSIMNSACNVVGRCMIATFVIEVIEERQSHWAQHWPVVVNGGAPMQL